MTVFIGDVHGKWSAYTKIIAEHRDTIQVGDMGHGFIGPDNVALSNPPHTKMVAGNHRFIRGNHDNPRGCRKHSQCINDGTVEGDTMFIGGALSIDRAWRTQGYDYWSDEELSAGALDDLLMRYLAARPRVMVTHDCPEMIADRLLRGRRKFDDPSVTRQAFQRYWEEYQPDLWVFGHWHTSFDMVVNGTHFVCLDELEVRDL